MLWLDVNNILHESESCYRYIDNITESCYRYIDNITKPESETELRYHIQIGKI